MPISVSAEESISLSYVRNFKVIGEVEIPKDAFYSAGIIGEKEDYKSFDLDQEIVNESMILLISEFVRLCNKKSEKEQGGFLSIIGNFSNYLFQAKCLIVSGKNIVYFNALPVFQEDAFLEKVNSGKLINDLVLVDGGGFGYWQAYVDLDEELVEIEFNQDF